MKRKLQILCCLVLLLMGGGGAVQAWAVGATKTYVFSSRDWEAKSDNVAANWTSGTRAGGFTDGLGTQITTSATGANATSPQSFSNISKIVVTYCTNNKKGKGDIKLKVGEEGTEQSFTVTAPSSGGGNTLKTTEFDYNPTESGSVTITVTCTENSIYIYSIAITYDDGQTIPEGPTDPAVSFAADPFSLVIGSTGTNAITKPDDLTVSYSSEDESVAKIDATTGEVTAVAIGQTTITATWEDVEDTYNAGSKTYTLKVTEPLSVIDFESDLTAYTDWTFVNIKSQQTSTNVTPHGGSSFGTTDGKATSSITTTKKIPYPKALTCYVSKQTTNTTVCYWTIQVSDDGEKWTDVSSISASSMNRGDWKELTADLSEYNNVYVRISYGSNTAVRCIDDVSLSFAAENTVTIRDINYATYVPTKNIVVGTAPEFYAVKDNKKQVTLNKLDEGTIVNAGTPVVVKGENTTYVLTTTDEEGTAIDTDLKASDGNVVGDGTIYVLNSVNGQVGFYKLKAGNTLAARKAYLQASDSNEGVKYFGSDDLDDTPTAITDVEIEAAAKAGAIYNLAGQRVTAPTHGIYIINGKKFIVK